MMNIKSFLICLVVLSIFSVVLADSEKENADLEIGDISKETDDKLKHQDDSEKDEADKESKDISKETDDKLKHQDDSEKDEADKESKDISKETDDKLKHQDDSEKDEADKESKDISEETGDKLKIQKQEHDLLRSSSIVFLEKLNKCPMYSTICSFSVLINKSINIENIKLESSDLVVFKNISIKLCQQEINNLNVKSSSSCPSLIEFKSFNKDSYNDYLTYQIFYVPDLIGVADLMININDTENIENNVNLNYTIIVVQPKRVIDLVFDIYVWTFSLLISTLMGVLIEPDALKDIIKMPIPAAIGFVCQYMCMPLVCRFESDRIRSFS
jgi:hypothetical protein